MKYVFSAHVWPEGDGYVAQAIETDVASQGESVDEALENLREALELYYEESGALPAHQLHRIEVDIPDR